jgi:hypothetical protein
MKYIWAKILLSNTQLENWGHRLLKGRTEITRSPYKNEVISSSDIWDRSQKCFKYQNIPLFYNSELPQNSERRSRRGNKYENLKLTHNPWALKRTLL